MRVLFAGWSGSCRPESPRLPDAAIRQAGRSQSGEREKTMSLEMWRPLREMRRLSGELERYMGETGPLERYMWEPLLGGRMRLFPINVYQKGNDVIVDASLPGVRPEDVDVSVSGRTLTIRAERHEAREATEEDYLYREVETGRFFRQVALPTEVQADKADARFENGMLRLRLPSTQAAGESHIKVKAA